MQVAHLHSAVRGSSGFQFYPLIADKKDPISVREILQLLLNSL